MDRSHGLSNTHFWTMEVWGLGSWVVSDPSSWEKALVLGRTGFQSWLQLPCCVTFHKSLCSQMHGKNGLFLHVHLPSGWDLNELGFPGLLESHLALSCWIRWWRSFQTNGKPMGNVIGVLFHSQMWSPQLVNGWLVTVLSSLPSSPGHVLWASPAYIHLLALHSLLRLPCPLSPALPVWGGSDLLRSSIPQDPSANDWWELVRKCASSFVPWVGYSQEAVLHLSLEFFSGIGFQSPQWSLSWHHAFSLSAVPFLSHIQRPPFLCFLDLPLR
jgi:hypothetical protein